jgi:ABC-type microcin C transport system duplicated ATPase subunit YejF
VPPSADPSATATLVGSAAADGPLLAVRDLHVRLGDRGAEHDVLRGVDLDVGPGEVVGVIGETGSGKTTLARTVVGLVRPAAGEVRFAGQDLTRLRGRRLRAFRRAGEVGLVFQDPLGALDPALRVVDLVTEGLAIRGLRDPAALRRAATDALALVGLGPELLDRVPADVSGGQRQRVAIARALVVRPRLLLFDEPVSALDATTRGEVLRTLRGLRDELGTALVIITHDLPSMLGVVDRVVVLLDGRVVEEGPTADVLGAPRHDYTRLLVDAAPAAVRRRLDAHASAARPTVPTREP